MKKAIIIFGIIIALSIIGYAGFNTFFSNSSFDSVNVNLGGLDEKAFKEMCKDKSGHSRLVCLSQELKKTVNADVSGKLQLSYSVADAQKWSNFPPAGYRNRVGPTLDQFNPDQLAIIKTLLIEAAGTAKNEGYDEIQQIMNADDFLKANGKGMNGGFSSGNYHLAFLGIPSDKGTWQLYFGGHHLAVGFTYTDGKLISSTPSFRGVEPFEKFTQNGRENQPMKGEQEAFAAMLNSLDEKEKAIAKLSQTFSDIIVGPQRDTNYPTLRNGIKVSDLSKEKQALVVKAIESYVADADDKNAKEIIEKYKSEFVDTFIAYSGTTDLNANNDYVRIDGTSVWIEISMQPGRSWDGIHPHSVWRDKRSDYGGNLGK
jgi:Protein of unknown function (DUF3500)